MCAIHATMTRMFYGREDVSKRIAFTYFDPRCPVRPIPVAPRCLAEQHLSRQHRHRLLSNRCRVTLSLCTCYTSWYTVHAGVECTLRVREIRALRDYRFPLLHFADHAPDGVGFEKQYSRRLRLLPFPAMFYTSFHASTVSDTA